MNITCHINDILEVGEIKNNNKRRRVQCDKVRLHVMFVLRSCVSLRGRKWCILSPTAIVNNMKRSQCSLQPILNVKCALVGTVFKPIALFIIE